MTALRRDCVWGEWETAAIRAEEVARDLVRQADALFDWAFEVWHTDPHPDTLRTTAEALGARARELRVLDGGVWGSA